MDTLKALAASYPEQRRDSLIKVGKSVNCQVSPVLYGCFKSKQLFSLHMSFYTKIPGEEFRIWSGEHDYYNKYCFLDKYSGKSVDGILNCDSFNKEINEKIKISNLEKSFLYLITNRITDFGMLHVLSYKDKIYRKSEFYKLITDYNYFNVNSFLLNKYEYYGRKSTNNIIYVPVCDDYINNKTDVYKFRYRKGKLIEVSRIITDSFN